MDHTAKLCVFVSKDLKAFDVKVYGTGSSTESRTTRTANNSLVFLRYTYNVAVTSHKPNFRHPVVTLIRKVLYKTSITTLL
jgi:hypothetical protein